MVHTVAVSATAESTAVSCDLSLGRPTQAKVTGVASVVEIEPECVSGNVVTNIRSGSDRRNATKATCEWSPISFYNAGISDGSANYDTQHLWTRYATDASDKLELFVKLGRPSTGNDRIVWQVVGASDYADFVEFDETRVNGLGQLEMAPKAGLDFHRIVVTYKPRTGWFAPRRIILRLLSGNMLEVDGITELMLIVRSSRTPPIIARTSIGTVGATAGSPWSVTFQLQNPDGSGYDMSTLIDTPKIYLGFWATNRLSYKDENRYHAGAFNNEVLTWTSATNTETFNITNSYTPVPGDQWRVVVLNEVYDASPRQITAINPENGLYTEVQYLNDEQNQWHWTNDFPRLGEEEYPTDGRGRKPGYPTGYKYGGNVLFNYRLEDVFFDIQKDASPALDWYTGNAITYGYDSANVKLGPSYVRQLFTVGYTGGPLIGPDNEQIVRSAKHIEPFKAADVGRQAHFVRVGYQARNTNRSHAVAMRMRNVDPQSGYAAFGVGQAGDETLGYLPQTQIRFQGVPSVGQVVTIKLPPDWSIFYDFTVVTTVTGPWQFQAGSLASDAAANFVASVNEEGNGIRVGARIEPSDVTGTIVNLYVCDRDTGKASRLVNPGDPGYATLHCVSQGPGIPFLDPAYLPVSIGGVNHAWLKDPNISDASGNSCLPSTAVRSNGTTFGDVDASGDYYYDAETGVEFWLWSMRNMWVRNRNCLHAQLSYPVGWTKYDMCAPERLSASRTRDAWGFWYGVARTPAGIVAWMMNYHPELPVGFNPDSGTPPYADTTDIVQYAGGVANAQVYDTIDMTTHPPARSLSPGATVGWLIEDAGAPTPELSSYTNSRGWTFAGTDRTTLVDFPIYVTELDGSDKVFNFAQLKADKRGLMQYMMYLHSTDHVEAMRSHPGASDDHAAYVPPVNQGNFWSPLGNALGKHRRYETLGYVTVNY